MTKVGLELLGQLKICYILWSKKFCLKSFNHSKFWVYLKFLNLVLPIFVLPKFGPSYIYFSSICASYICSSYDVWTSYIWTFLSLFLPIFGASYGLRSYICASYVLSFLEQSFLCNGVAPRAEGWVWEFVVGELTASWEWRVGLAVFRCSQANVSSLLSQHPPGPQAPSIAPCRKVQTLQTTWRPFLVYKTLWKQSSF